MSIALTLHNIQKNFREPPEKELTVLKNISLEIAQEEFFVFVGPSGSGKSTLLRIMSGLEKPSSGEVIWGRDLTKRNFSFVFQQFALLPWLTVYKNVELGIIPQHLPDAQRHQKVTQELKRLGLEKFSSRYPRELSGGMRQRVGFARALVANPRVIFMDEPFSELDSFTAVELRHELLQIWQEKKPTIIMVTHLIQEALELADRIAILTPLPGKIEKIITNPLPRPRNTRTQEFYTLEDEIYNIIKP